MERCPVISFDHHSKNYSENWMATYRDLHNRCPVAWTDAHKGYWVVSGYDELYAAVHDDETFSSRHDFPNGSSEYLGVGIPPSEHGSIPLEMDPPELLSYRKLLMQRFTPHAVDKLRPTMLRFANYCIDRVIETGSADLVLDLASPLPAMMTMELMGVPVEQWQQFAEPIHAVVYTPPYTPEAKRVQDKLGELWDMLRRTIASRRQHPTEDLASYLIQTPVDGRPLTDEVIFQVLVLVIFGGIDTTTALLSHALDYLDLHPDIRPKLLEDRKLMLSASEEFLRFYSPVQSLARTATKDVELGGQHLKKGDRVLLCWAGANHDPSAFDKPDEVVLDRFPNKHAAFGLGAHRCLGSNIARAEFTIMLKQILTRMPDYRIVRDQTKRYDSIGGTNGYIKMPATFSPGDRVGASLQV